MTTSPSVEEAVRHWLSKLEQNFETIQHCKVVIERPHNHQRHGNNFHVHIDLTVPGRELAVSREPERDPGHEDVYLALSDAFRAARRQLQEHAEHLRSHSV